jgi:RNA polymerase sigma factor (sigma-70 family)
MTVIEPPVRDLLERLSGSKTSAAWKEFLERFTPSIMHIVRRYESDHGQVTDCFVHVCEALSDTDFRRLRSYRPDGAASFRTWLMAVTVNICIDWKRQKHGRFRPIRTVANLPELDQLVYRYIYVRGISRAECLHELAGRFPHLNEQSISEINTRLFRLLTPQQRWQLRTGTVPAVALDEYSAPGPNEPAPQFEDPAPGPAEAAETAEVQKLLKVAMTHLLPNQRLLLRLRYEQNLTLAEIARLTHQPDPFRVHRQIQAALAELSKLISRRGVKASKKLPDASV